MALCKGLSKAFPGHEHACERLVAGALRGIGVSAGVARGRVRVLTSVSDWAVLREGEILVVRSLDPTWTIAYARAAGLVAERGAVLSHGAIVAREFALPAVVNVLGATSHLRNGEEVAVDGTTGEVRRLGPRPKEAVGRE